jgi:hypothetical protein
MSKRYRYMNTETPYVYIGTAMPAGTTRDQGMPPIEVYQHPQTGELYYRTVEDFAERMNELTDILPIFLMAGRRTLEREHPALVCCQSCCDAAIKAEPKLMLRIAMICCSVCGNKRCPKTVNHHYQCSGSNELGQKGVLVK